MNRSETKRIGDVLATLKAEEPDFHEALLHQIAKQKFRDLTSVYAQEIGQVNIQNDVLLAQVSSSTLRHVLLLNREQILRDINEVIGFDFLRDLVFR